ncbi:MULTISPECIES: DUF1127 domain-containing protein [Actibacterium]|uniref:Uncharacterized protein YjiS (DUF1127 family) n=1 Tax=Actibacterium naphthalenivorans TaxID=1614693 RepID=A0A840C8V1_9RHOB|nr:MULTISPECIES: DUF1127 domain-containing protein [Actibacterium]ALG89815.1 hypothetical protein TQ29_05935 [Actibacterium sp. EMB200-NS6]MBB4020472.1 uncharacterized protein YjiS (DUF1127 family) [Actibacterium naphthalenivorans]
MAHAQQIHVAQSGLAEWLKSGVSAAREWISRRRVYNRTVDELSTLTARELSDLGISRSMIHYVARDAAHGK